MSKRLLFFIFFLVSVSIFGQSKMVDGYVITNLGDTLYGQLKIEVDRNDKLDHAKIQDRIVFTNKDGESTVYLPGSIRSFYFYYNFYTPIFVSVKFYKESELFLMVIGDQDYMKLYKYYPMNEKSLTSAFELAEYVYGVTDFDERFFFYILRPDGDRLLLGKHTPQSKILGYFKDCPSIAQKLESREYNYADIYQMVREYNHWVDENNQ